MFRRLGRAFDLLLLAALAAALVAGGGRLGPLDLTEVPLPLVAFLAVNALVLLALRRI